MVALLLLSAACASGTFNDGGWRCFEDGWAQGSGVKGAPFWARGPVFDARREAPLFGVRDPRVAQASGLRNRLILDQRGWATHKMTSFIAAILLQERIGYRVGINPHGGTSIARMAPGYTASPAHADLELWGGSGHDMSLVGHGVDSLGSLGVLGSDGIFTTRRFQRAMVAAHGADPGWWRGLQHAGVVAALAYENPLFNGTLLGSCFTSDGGKAPTTAAAGAERCTTCKANTKWQCANGTYRPPLAANPPPSNSERGVLSMIDPLYSPGQVQQAFSNLQLPYALTFLGQAALERHALAREAADKPVLFYHWDPGVFTSRHRHKFVRTMLPPYSTACKKRNTRNVTGGYDCDWELSPLLKLSSSLLGDPAAVDGPAKAFLRSFVLNREDYDWLLNASQNDGGGGGGGSEDYKYYRTACAWLKTHHSKWSPWLDKPPPKAGHCLRGDVVPIAAATDMARNRSKVFGVSRSDSGLCASHFAKHDTGSGGGTCAPAALASELTIYDHGLSLLFPMCASCSDLWSNVLCAASFDAEQASFVSAPPMQSANDVAALSTPATLELSAALAEQLFAACKGARAEEPTIYDAFGGSARKFAEWMGQNRLKVLRCQGLSPQDTCIIAPLRVKVVAEDAGRRRGRGVRQGLNISYLRARNPDIQIDGACRTAGVDPFFWVAVVLSAVIAAGILWRVGRLAWKRFVRARPEVMISYRHTDAAFARRLEAALRRARFRVWVDTAITPGEDWRQDIANAIQRSVAVVFIISPGSVTSKYCKEELFYASALHKPVFPVVLKDAFEDLQGGVKTILQRKQWIQMDAFDVGFEKLRIQLKQAFKESKSATGRGAQERSRPSRTRTVSSRTTASLTAAQKDCTPNEADFAGDVFVCFDVSDAALAKALEAALEKRKLRCMRTRHVPVDGEDAPVSSRKEFIGGVSSTSSCFEANALSIKGCAVLVFVLSERSIRNEQCGEELHEAYELGKPLFVVTSAAPDRVPRLLAMRGSVGMMLESSSHGFVIADSAAAAGGLDDRAQTHLLALVYELLLTRGKRSLRRNTSLPTTAAEKAPAQALRRTSLFRSLLASEGAKASTKPQRARRRSSDGSAQRTRRRSSEDNALSRGVATHRAATALADDEEMKRRAEAGGGSLAQQSPETTRAHGGRGSKAPVASTALESALMAVE